MGTMGRRIRELREALPGTREEKSQELIATRAGRPGRAGQVWLSRIESRQEPSVEEAILIIDALGPWAADFVIVPRERRALVKAIGSATPADAGLALRLLEILPDLDEGGRRLIESMLQEPATSPARAAAAVGRRSR